MPEEGTIGSRIRRKREEVGLSLSALADLAKISKGYLSQIESGDVEKPSAPVLYRIAQNLGTTMAHLMGEIREPTAEEPEPVDTVLLQFAREHQLSDEDIQMLAGIKRRGKAPQTADDWRFIYEAIKRTIGD